MRIRTSLSIAVLAGAAVALPLYLIARGDSAVSEAANTEGAAVSPAAGDSIDNRFCAHREGDSGVAVGTGPDCAQRALRPGPDALAITVTREADSVVITAADP